jgi:hypothetical protein
MADQQQARNVKRPGPLISTATKALLVDYQAFV